MVLCLLAGVALAMPVADEPAPYNGPPPPPAKVYKSGPAAPQGYKEAEENFPPQPYQFEYGVQDQYTGANYKAAETKDDKGTVLGEYKVNLPDGRVQTVTYRADANGGFVADVAYEGEAAYPPEPAEGYGNSYKKTKPNSYEGAPVPSAPKYAPAPAAPAPKYPAPPKYEPSEEN
jgi:hypothetical protein